MFWKKKNSYPQQNSYMAQRRMILGEHSPFLLQEAYKTLRTNIRFSLREEGCKKFCITSSVSGEGKSITLLNLAISFAQDGQRVLLVDADMRRPTMARLLVEKAAPGLSTILAGMDDQGEAIRKEMFPNLDIVFSGEVPPNPSELLGSERMKNFLEEMSKQYDYILVDTPPVSIVSDACIVANFLDGALLLARQGRTRKDAVRRAVNQLDLTGTKLLGFVLNGVDKSERGSYGYYYYEYSNRDTKK